MATGLSQYVRYSLTPESAAPTLGFGLGVTGGSSEDVDEPNEIEFVGGGSLLVGQMLKPRGSVICVPTTIAPFDLGQRASSGYPGSALTPFSIGYAKGGVLEVFYNAQVTRQQIELNFEDALRLTTDWLALKKVEVSPVPSVSPTTGTPWQWYQFAKTINSLGRKFQSATITRDNQCTHNGDLDGATAGERRWPKSIDPGHEQISLEIRCRERLTDSERGHLADDLATIPASFVATRGGQTLTFTLQNLYNTQHGNDLQAGAEQDEYSYTFRAQLDDPDALAITIS